MRRGKHGVFGFSLLVLTSVWPAAQAAPPADADLAARAWGILRAHCLRCHGGKAPKADLKILDRSMLVDDRKVIIPGKAEASELFDLVRGKTMPPGNQPKVEKAELETLQRWIDNGAPSIYGDRYVVDHILRDWNALPKADKRSTRYLSLNHLAHPSRTPDQLPKAREQLNRTLTSLAKRGGGMQPIDPEKTVFRISLPALGWDATPFHEIKLDENAKPPRKAIRKSSVNLYDLLLLEYPYGVLDFSSPSMPALAHMFAETEAIRPIPYIRGDWAVTILTETPMGSEFAKVVGWPWHKPEVGVVGSWMEEVSLEDAAAELAWQGDLPKLGEALANEGLKELGEGLKELGSGKTMSRNNWEAVFPRLITALNGTGKRVPIIPINGLTMTKYRPAGNFSYAIQAIDPKTKKAEMQFRNGDKVWWKITVNEDAQVERIVTYNGRAVERDPNPQPRTSKGSASLFPDQFIRTFLPKQSEIVESIISYAIPNEVLRKNKLKFPTGTLIGPEKDNSTLRDRFIHPLYQLSIRGDRFEGVPVEKMLKTTLPIEIRP